MAFRLTLIGVGAMDSPRFAPAGLLLDLDGTRLRFDGGPDAPEPAQAWLLTDDRAELAPTIRRAARKRGMVPRMASWAAPGLAVEAHPVVHTSHPTIGYLIMAEGRRIVWAPEFYAFPDWASGADLMFADAAAWDRPIRFAGGVGGHAAALDTALAAVLARVQRLVFAHMGRPTIRAMDRGDRPPFGSFGFDGARYEPRRWRRPRDLR